jgi:hypothetical protein
VYTSRFRRGRTLVYKSDFRNRIQSLGKKPLFKCETPRAYTAGGIERRVKGGH